MQHLLPFPLYEQAHGLTKVQTYFLNSYVKGTWNINPEMGLIDVKGAVNFSREGFIKIPVLFGTVTEDFSCSRNKLVSLEGVPKKVGGNFNCWGNQLSSLEGAPEEVEGYFDCSNNQLSSLEGTPREVGGDFNCSNNQLTSLEGAPKEVGGYFKCWGNPVSEEALTIIFLKMREGIPYKQALLASLPGIEGDDREILLTNANLSPQEVLTTIQNRVPLNWQEIIDNLESGSPGFTKEIELLGLDWSLVKKLTTQWRLLQRDI